MVDPDKALSNIRIRQASAFSVNVQGELVDPELTPILFAKHLVEAASESGDLLVKVSKFSARSKARTSLAVSAW